ncbi:MAG: macro domain-containing protein [Saprospiraceae bacterium]|nr:macro domain-containing protein [Bacteroidia bacterium]NNE16371.1 macro domain-containing protein [Saprospiraceae bacterium]NNL92988.1 macro domain-containing protein [Saprospiraceae bacterium]
MIKEVKGDILLTGAQAIAHGVAPNDHFDRGLALSLRENYPAMAKDFRHYCRLENPPPGEVWMWGTVDHFRIFNLMTQEPAKTLNGHPGSASHHNVNLCLKNLVKAIKGEKITSLALPKLATGYGKMNWDEVLPLIKKHLGDLDIPVYVYSTYVKGQKGAE